MHVSMPNISYYVAGSIAPHLSTQNPFSIFIIESKVFQEKYIC